MTELFVSITGDPSATFSAAFDLLESKTFTANQPKAIPGGATITMLPMEGKRALTYDAAPAVEFILTTAGAVGTGMIANYLYDKLSGRKDKIKMTTNRRTTNVDQGEITQVIEEEIKLSIKK